MSTDSEVLGVLILARHGDRQGFYQSPTTYTPTATKITPQGNQEEFMLGQYLRNRYLTPSSPHFISRVNSSIVDLNQILVRADAGGEGGVILQSAQSLTQGLFPANDNYTTTLANGTRVTGPLGGYQYVSIESVEPTNDISFEGWTNCSAFDRSTNAFYQSAAFKQKAADSQSFLTQLPPFLDGRNVTLDNMWNIYDFMNVQNIHDANFHNHIPATFMEQARNLANFHEYGVFSSADLNGIPHIAFRTLVPSLTTSLRSIADTNNKLKFVYFATAYKPFLSMFSMTGVAQMNQSLAGIVNYAGTVALEVRQPAGGGSPVVRFNFKNGSDDTGYNTYGFMNNSAGEIPLQQLIDHLQPAAINSTADWCNVCGNTQDRGCGALSLAAASTTHHQKISPVGAGFLGAGLTIFVALVMLSVLYFLGLIAFGKKSKGRSSGSVSSDEKA
ncbi:phosphoglycerate mutase-like protein [Marasmius fiardii PR-910]|nr:phosphoglycerate mutase-like protein [Marasmius fiardii PR-910]